MAAITFLAISAVIFAILIVPSLYQIHKASKKIDSLVEENSRFLEFHRQKMFLLLFMSKLFNDGTNHHEEP
jgi:hypothetical protein